MAKAQKIWETKDTLMKDMPIENGKCLGENKGYLDYHRIQKYRLQNRSNFETTWKCAEGVYI